MPGFLAFLLLVSQKYLKIAPTGNIGTLDIIEIEFHLEIVRFFVKSGSGHRKSGKQSISEAHFSVPLLSNLAKLLLKFGL